MDASLQPFQFDLLPEDYRYNRELWGLGRNCGVQKFRVAGTHPGDSSRSFIW